MAKKKQNHPPVKKSSKIDKRRIFVAILAGAMAVLMLLPMFATLFGSAGAVTQAEINNLKKSQAAARVRQQELKAQLDSVKNDKAKAEQQRKIVTEQLNLMVEELKSINKQITYYDGEIAAKEAERQEALAREEEQYDLFCKRVRAMEEAGDVSYWAVLFGASDFSDLLDRAILVGEIMDYDNAVMDQLTATREKIEQLKADLETARSEEQAAKQELEVRKAEQQEKVKEAKKLLAEINADMAEVNRQLDAESAAVREIQNEIIKKQRAMEEERRKNNVTIDSESNYLWPLPGYYKLSSLFGYRIHPITHRAHSHSGIDIPAPSGTPILAAKSGQVTISSRHYSYGNYVSIDHGNGNSTLYAHMSKRNVTEGQMVKQGDVIGYVGSTGSSTAPHLHLEVRVNYSRVDPESKYKSLHLKHPW